MNKKIQPTRQMNSKAVHNYRQMISMAFVKHGFYNDTGLLWYLEQHILMKPVLPLHPSVKQDNWFSI